MATRPLEQRDSIPHLRPTARQRARPAELSGRQGGLWLHSWGLAVAPTLQAPPLLLSTSHSHGSSLCGYPHSHSTEAVPAGLSTHRIGGSPTRDAPRCVTAVSLRMSVALQRLHFIGPVGARYDSTDTRRPQSSVTERTLDTPGPRATDTMKWGVGRRSLLGSWSRRPERSCVTPWTWVPRVSSSSQTTLSGMPRPRFFTSSRAMRASGSVKVWKLTPSPHQGTAAR